MSQTHGYEYGRNHMFFVIIDGYGIECNQGNYYKEICGTMLYINTGCAKKKKDILNIYIKSEGINIFHKNFAGQRLPYLWSNVKSSHL